MQLNKDIILDRKNLKKSIMLWRLLTIILGISIISFMTFKNKKPTKVNYIARIAVEDELILENYEREKKLREILNNDNIKAVILHINTPGGSMVGSENLYFALRKIAEHKPLVAVMGSVAASGGYMISLASDYILARHGTITGSIGVILQGGDITELAKKIGINLYNFKSSPLKASPSPLEPLTPEVENAVNSAIMDNYYYFVDMVATRRNISSEDALILADGRIYTGHQAKMNKLIDEIGGEDEAIKWLKDKHNINYSIKEVALIKKKYNISDFISASGVLGKLSNNINGLMNIWHPN